MANEQEPLPEVHAPGGLEHPSVRREPRDLYNGWVIAVLLFGAAIVGLNFVAVWWYFHIDEQRMQNIKTSNYPLAPPPSERLPPEPRLDPLNEIIGAQEGNAYRRELAQLDQLNKLGRSDEKGFVRIPIEDAIKLAPSRLKSRKSDAKGTVSKDEGLRFGGGPNSGRVFEEAR